MKLLPMLCLALLVLMTVMAVAVVYFRMREVELHPLRPPLGPRPLIKRDIPGRWTCHSEPGGWGCGNTPAAAYAAWEKDYVTWEKEFRRRQRLHKAALAKRWLLRKT